jgi:hypothetical protein
MADAKISALPAATLPLAGTEILPLVQSSTTKEVATDDLTVKNIRSNATTGILQIAGPAAAATRVMTTPDANFSVGYLDIPQNSQSADYTLALTDDGKHIYQTGASKTVTIPDNGTVVFPIGSVITIVAATNSVSIAITTDTLRWAVDGSTGTRTLAAYGIATILKTSSTEWRINGTGLS